MQHIIPTLTFMGLLIALVSAVDRIMDKGSKKLLGNSIKSRITGHHYDIVDVRNPVSFIERVQPFSVRSAVVSAKLSIAALAIVIYVQYFALNYNFSEMVVGVSDKHLNYFLAFLAYMVIANIFVDYISFTQTLVIIRLINKTDSRKSLIVLLFTDLLASINIFTFAYAFFLVLGVTSMLNFQERASFLVSIEEGEVTGEITKIMEEIGSADPDRYKRVSILRLTTAKESTELVDGYIFGTHSAEPVSVFPMLKSVLEKAFPNSSTNLAQETGTITPYQLFPTLTVDYVFKGAMNIDLSAPSLWGHWYSVGYLLTDDVQDNFFAVAELSPGFKEVDQLRADAGTRVAALSLRDVVVNWCPTDQTRRELDDTSCPTSFVFVSRNISVLDKKLAIETNIGGKLPLYTFFFTSLSLTLVIYLFYLSIYLFRVAWLFAGNISLPLVRLVNFDEHPVTILSVPLILLAGLVYFLLSG